MAYYVEVADLRKSYVHDIDMEKVPKFAKGKWKNSCEVGVNCNIPDLRVRFE